MKIRENKFFLSNLIKFVYERGITLRQKNFKEKLHMKLFSYFFLFLRHLHIHLATQKIRISLSKTCLNSYKSSIWLTSFIGLIVFQTYIIRFTVVHLTKGLHFQALCVGDKLYKKENFTSSESAWHVISIR